MTQVAVYRIHATVAASLLVPGARVRWLGQPNWQHVHFPASYDDRGDGVLVELFHVQRGPMIHALKGVLEIRPVSVKDSDELVMVPEHETWEEAYHRFKLLDVAWVTFADTFESTRLYEYIQATRRSLFGAFSHPLLVSE